MSIANSANLGTPAWRRLVRIPWVALLASITVVTQAQQFVPAPKFAGKLIPEPPNQGQPWTAPATKLPKVLVNATGILCDQGVADPRGSEYRQVEIGNGAIVKARGFVLPERGDAPGRFVVCWDGLVYPALSVGAAADLDSDIKELAMSLKRSPAIGQSNRFGQGPSWAFSREGRNNSDDSGIDDSSPIKLCLLLRIGRADLAETLFSAGSAWTPEPRGPDLTDYGINYLSLAFDWAAAAFLRLIRAHERGDDVIALDAARKLARFRELASAQADALGFPRERQRNRYGPGPARRFSFLTQLDELLGDHERRAKVRSREPIPRRGDDPSARIEALIDGLDQIVAQIIDDGHAAPGNSPLVGKLIAEGDPAVAPLLKVLESDNRLTRMVSYNVRGSPIERFVHPVHEIALTALIGILKTHEFDNKRFFGWKTVDPGERKALAASIRQFWKKTRSVPLVDH